VFKPSDPIPLDVGVPLQNVFFDYVYQMRFITNNGFGLLKLFLMVRGSRSGRRRGIVNKGWYDRFCPIPARVWTTPYNTNAKYRQLILFTIRSSRIIKVIVNLSLLVCRIAGNNSGSLFLREAAHFSDGPFGLCCCCWWLPLGRLSKNNIN